MPDFQGTKSIILQPGDVRVPYTFTWTICSATTGNDGAIPFGYTVGSVSTVVKHESGVNTLTIITTSSHTHPITTLWLTYPSSAGFLTGKYHLTFTAIITGATSFAKEFDFNRLIVKDK